MTLDQLLIKLQSLRNEGYQDIKIVAVEGSTGVFMDIGGVHPQKARYESEEGWWFEENGIKDGEEYMELYIGK